MPAPLLESILAIIQHELELGRGAGDIEAQEWNKAIGVSWYTIRNMRRCWRKYGVVSIPTDKPRGRPQVISQVHEQAILQYLEERPGAYLDEVVFYLLIPSTSSSTSLLLVGP